MIGILIVTHGTLGESLIQCASHVLGARPPQLLQLDVDSQDDPAALLLHGQQLVKELDQGQGVLILSDIYGATPCNIVGRLLEPGRVEGVAGINLPMLVRTLTYRNGNLPKLIEKALSGGRDGVIHFTEEACKKNE
jgi:PTS system mannose-specific IIA component